MEGFRIVPYTTVDGIPTFKDSQLAELYNQDALEDILFHDGTIQSETDFIMYVKSTLCKFFVVVREADREIHPVAYFWINRLEQTHCYMHWTFLPSAWGTGVSIPVANMVLDFLTEHWPLILGMLPATNKRAIEFVKSFGAKAWEVPNLIWSDKEERPVDGLFIRLTREDFENDNLHKGSH